MIKTISLSLVTAIFAYLVWQVTALNNELGKVESLAQQLSNLATEIRSVDNSTTEQPNQTETNQAIIDIQTKTSDIGQRLSDLENQLTNLSQTVNAVNQSADFNPETQQTLAMQISAFDIAEPTLPSASEDLNNQQARTELLETMMMDPARIDSDWSNSTQVAIEQTIANTPDLDVASVSDTQCGGTLCKVQVTLPSNLGEEEKNIFSWNLLMNVLGEELPNGTYFIENNPDGSQQLTYYLVRQGNQLPISQ